MGLEPLGPTHRVRGGGGAWQGSPEQVQLVDTGEDHWGWQQGLQGVRSQAEAAAPEHCAARALRGVLGCILTHRSPLPGAQKWARPPRPRTGSWGFVCAVAGPRTPVGELGGPAQGSIAAGGGGPTSWLLGSGGPASGKVRPGWMCTCGPRGSCGGKARQAQGLPRQPQPQT